MCRRFIAVSGEDATFIARFLEKPVSETCTSRAEASGEHMQKANAADECKRERGGNARRPSTRSRQEQEARSRCMHMPKESASGVRLLSDSLDAGGRACDAYPESLVCVIASQGDGGDMALETRELTWGFSVEWQRGPVFNTRLESALGGSALWREAFASRRCIVPARGFYESHSSEKTRSLRTGRLVKRQYLFRPTADAGDAALLIAGVYENDRFSVVTCEPNAAVAPVHNRMPLVLSPAEARLWLDPAAPLEALAALADRSGIHLQAQAASPAASPSAPPDQPDQLSLF